jgi:hypothetical protein
MFGTVVNRHYYRNKRKRFSVFRFKSVEKSVKDKIFVEHDELAAIRNLFLVFF